jgi:glycine betaine/proline transport system substrate-binding protein
VLERFRLPLADIETMLKQVDVDGRPVEDVAREWMEANQPLVQEWVAQ